MRLIAAHLCDRHLHDLIFILYAQPEMSSRTLFSMKLGRCLSSEINLCIFLGLTVDESILFQPGQLIFEQAETGLEETHPCSPSPLSAVLQEAEGISHSS